MVRGILMQMWHLFQDYLSLRYIYIYLQLYQDKTTIVYHNKPSKKLIITILSYSYKIT